MVLNDRKDIKIPQGIAHAVDRVMFPLPVGDLLQTLQSDRDARFTTFLKIVSAAEFNEKLQSKGRYLFEKDQRNIYKRISFRNQDLHNLRPNRKGIRGIRG